MQYHWKTELTPAVILERRQEPEWWWKKEHNMTLSEESGKGYRKMHLIPVFSARILHFVQEWRARRILHSTPYFFYHSVRHRILPSFENDGQIFNRITPAVILERRQEPEWWWKKEHNMTLSEESGKGYRKMYLIPVFSALILHFVQEWQAGIYTVL